MESNIQKGLNKLSHFITCKNNLKPPKTLLSQLNIYLKKTSIRPQKLISKNNAQSVKYLLKKKNFNTPLKTDIDLGLERREQKHSSNTWSMGLVTPLQLIKNKIETNLSQSNIFLTSSTTKHNACHVSTGIPPPHRCRPLSCAMTKQKRESRSGATQATVGGVGGS